MNSLKLLIGANPVPYIIGALTVLLIMSSLAGWALWERGEKLKALATVETLKGNIKVLQGEVAVLSGDIKTQNLSIDGWKAAAVLNGQRAETALADLDKQKLSAAGEIARLQGLINVPAADLTGKTCTDAWRDIRGIPPP